MVRDACSPFAERDACGIGFLAHLDGRPSPQVIADALTLLERLEHRGACGCDGATGDGAGLLMQIPDLFFRSWAREQGLRLPAPLRYGVGVFFLPEDRLLRRAVRRDIERMLHRHHLQALTWRDVPVRSNALGATAADTEPFIAQCLVAPTSHDPASHDPASHALAVSAGS
jgi:glutamate synthase domain-containing protein 1